MALLRRFFPEGQALEEAARILAEDAAGDLLSAQDSTSVDLERIRFAAISESEGDLRKLRSAIELSNIDWRDLLMNADFGFDTEAHDRWYEEVFSS